MAMRLAFIVAVLALGVLTSEADADPLMNPTEDELELMSQEMKKQELAQMIKDAEKLKVELSSPHTSPQRRVEAAAEFKKVYETTKFELYKASFKESLRMIGVSMDKLATTSCKEFGIHLDSEEDRFIRENCKKAIKMIWNLLLIDKLKKPTGLYASLKSNARDYLSRRLNISLPVLASN